MSQRDLLNIGIHVADRSVAAAAVPEAAPTLAAHGYSSTTTVGGLSVTPAYILGIVEFVAGTAPTATISMYGYSNPPSAGALFTADWIFLDTAALTSTGKRIFLIPVTGFSRFHAIVTAIGGGVPPTDVRIRYRMISNLDAELLISMGIIGGLASDINLIEVAGTAVLTGGVAGSQGVGGLTAPGAAPTMNPVSVAGVDAGGLGRRLLTDTDGTIEDDITKIAGTAVLTGGVAGSQGVGGLTAPGAAPTMNPLSVAGVDAGGLGRRLLTDTDGTVEDNITKIAGTAVLTGGVAGSQGVGGLTAPGAAPTMNPVSVSGVDAGGLGRRLLTDTDGTVEDNITKIAGTAILTGGQAGSQGVGGLAADDAVKVGNSIPVGGVANVAAPVAVEGRVRTLSLDLASYTRQVSKAYDAVAAADRVSPTIMESDRYEEGELLDTTNVGAATNYYPSSAGLVMEGFLGFCVQALISGGVTLTVEATLDNAGSPDWFDITPSGYDYLTDAAGYASFVDTNCFLDFDARVKAIRLKSVTSDATNAVQYHYKRTRRV